MSVSVSGLSTGLKLLQIVVAHTAVIEKSQFKPSGVCPGTALFFSFFFFLSKLWAVRWSCGDCSHRKGSERDFLMDCCSHRAELFFWALLLLFLTSQELRISSLWGSSAVLSCTSSVPCTGSTAERIHQGDDGWGMGKKNLVCHRIIYLSIKNWIIKVFLWPTEDEIFDEQ